MDAVRRDPDPDFSVHLATARKVLELPVEVSGLHWHPFGVYTLPLPRRTDGDGTTWSRRLHIWHPDGRPVGEASPYGVHTHSGTARSHVLLGSLTHHLYAFEADPDGIWRRERLGTPEGMASLLAHLHADTTAGMVHTLPKDHPHGVTKPDGAWAISLFEQKGGEKEQDFTTWTRTDVPEEALVRTGPVPVSEVQMDALRLLDVLA